MIIFTLKDILTHCDVSSARYNNRQFLGIFYLHGDVKRGVRRGGERLGNFSLHFTFYTHILFFLAYISSSSVAFHYHTPTTIRRMEMLLYRDIEADCDENMEE